MFDIMPGPEKNYSYPFFKLSSFVIQLPVNLSCPQLLQIALTQGDVSCCVCVCVHLFFCVCQSCLTSSVRCKLAVKLSKEIKSEHFSPISCIQEVKMLEQ